MKTIKRNNKFYTKQVLNKISYSLFTYSRIDFKNLTNEFKITSRNINYNKKALNLKFIANQFNKDLISYTLAPTNTELSTSKILPSFFPFKTSVYDISQGLNTLTKEIKRNKIPITSYNPLTRTYTLSNINIDFSNFYVSLKTRVYRKDIFREVIIQKVNPVNKTFTTTTDEWAKGFNNTNPSEFFVLDEQIKVLDETAGTWRLFPISNTSLTTDIEYINEFGHNIALNGNMLPVKDTSFSQNINYTQPFNLYTKTSRYVDRYFLPTKQLWRQRQNQQNSKGRYVYSQKPAFVEFNEVYVAPVSSKIVTNFNYENDTDSKIVNSNIYNKVVLNYRTAANQIVIDTPTTRVYQIQLNSFCQQLGLIPNDFSTTKASPLSVTNLGVVQANPLLYSNNTKWGIDFGLSDDNLVVGSPDNNQIHIYGLDYQDLPTCYLNVMPLSVITPPLSVFKNTLRVESLTGYGTNTVIDSRYKRKSSIDFVATTFKARLNNKIENIIEVFSLNNFSLPFKPCLFKREFHIVDSLIPHLSSNTADTNHISKLGFIIDSDVNSDKIVIVAAQRPNVIYKGKKGIIDLYGCSESTPVKLLGILNSDNSSLSATPGVNFGVDFSGELGSLCVSVSANNKSQIEVFDFDYNVVASTVSDSTTLSGVKSNYKLNFNILKTDTVLSTDNAADTNFGKNIYFDQALKYDPYYEDQPLYTNRLFVSNGEKIYVYEEFNNKFLPSKVFSNKSLSLGCYFNNFASISARGNTKVTTLLTVSAYEVGSPIQIPVSPVNNPQYPKLTYPSKYTKVYEVYVAGNRGSKGI